MIYTDGNDPMLGDKVWIGQKYTGLIVALIDEGQFSAGYPKEEWEYLGKGALVLTEHAGLVHYKTFDQDEVLILERGNGC